MAPDSLVFDCRRRPAVDSPLTPMPTDELSSFQPKEKCPRCESRDTKFCYYNNYNTSQPRHFCRSCRRYWTLGGSLRNIPIGGSTRTNSNKRLRPNPNPLSNPNPSRNSPHVPTTTSCFLPLQVPPFRFDLGLGLKRFGPSASIADMGFGLGPTTLVWPSSLLGTGSPTTGCFAVPAPVDGGAGPSDGERA